MSLANKAKKGLLYAGLATGLTSTGTGAATAITTGLAHHAKAQVENASALERIAGQAFQWFLDEREHAGIYSYQHLEPEHLVGGYGLATGLVVGGIVLANYCHKRLYKPIKNVKLR